MKIERRAKLAIHDGYGTHWTKGTIEFQEHASHRGSLKTRNDEGIHVVEKMLTRLIKRGVKPGTKIIVSIATFG